MADPIADASSWLTDFLANVFLSPSWERPLMDFIDEHCLEFDDDQEEHRLMHTELHQKFCELVDALLEVHLAEISLSAEDFMAVLMKSPQQSELRTIVMEQIMAVDDFLTFKKLMVKRARELRVIQLEKAVSDRAGLTAASDPPDPDLHEALRRSEAEAVAGGIVGTPTAEAQALQQALEASQAEWAELERARAALEIAQLEAAIAASLAMEDQRLSMVAAAAREREAAEEEARKAAAQKEEALPAPVQPSAYPAMPPAPAPALPPVRPSVAEVSSSSLPSLSSSSLPALNNRRAPVLSSADRGELEALLGESSGLKNEEEVDAARRRAEEMFQRNRARLADLDTQGGAARGDGMGEDALEIARRKKHLAELRDQLRASKAQQQPASPAQPSGSLPPLRPGAGGGAGGVASPEEVSRRQALAAKIRAEMSL